MDALEYDSLVIAIANRPHDTAKQICLYAMMKQYRLIWDFMITIIGEKYCLSDMTFGKIDVNGFFLRLQEQDDWVASWNDSPIEKLKQVIEKLLADNDYLDSTKLERLKPVLISPILESAIQENGIAQALIAFNCFR